VRYEQCKIAVSRHHGGGGTSFALTEGSSVMVNSFSFSCICPTLLLLAAGSYACAAQGQQPNIQVQAVDFEERTIYHSPQTPGYTCWVRLWQLPDGALSCDFFQFTGPKEEGAGRHWRHVVESPGNLHVTRPLLESRDAARTWTRVSNDVFRCDGRGFAVRGIAVLQDGTMVQAGQPVTDEGENLPESGYLQRSTDGGKTWGERIYFLPVQDYRTCPTLIRTLRDGRLVLFAGCYKRGDRENADGSFGFNMTKMMFVSSDGGKTWSKPIILMPGNVGACEESDFCELPNGDLFWVHRSQHFPDHKTDISPLAARMAPDPPSSYWYSDRMQSIARKVGDTFVPDPPTAAPFPHSGFPAVLWTREGVILHLDNVESHWSADTGKTWHKLMVGDKPVCTSYYPQAIQMADGRVVCIGHAGGDDVYGDGDQSIVQHTFRLSVTRPE